MDYCKVYKLRKSRLENSLWYLVLVQVFNYSARSTNIHQIAIVLVIVIVVRCRKSSMIDRPLSEACLQDTEARRVKNEKKAIHIILANF